MKESIPNPPEIALKLHAFRITGDTNTVSWFRIPPEAQVSDHHMEGKKTPKNIFKY